MASICVFSGEPVSKCQPGMIAWTVFTNLLCLKEVVSDCRVYNNDTNAFNPTASGCLQDEQIAGTLQYPVLELGSDPTVVAFRHENQWDHSSRMIYSFAFDTTLVDNSTAADSVSSWVVNQEPVFQVDDSATFDIDIHYRTQGETDSNILLSNARYVSPYIFENTFYIEIDPPLQVGPGVITVYVQLLDYQWPADIASNTGSGYLSILSCSNTPDCNEFADSWRDIAIEHDYYQCPGAYSDLLRAYLQICRNESLLARETTSILSSTHETTQPGFSTTAVGHFQTTLQTDIAENAPPETIQITQRSKSTPKMLKTTSMRTTSRVPVTTDPTAQLYQQLERLADIMVTSENVASVAENLTSLVAEDTILDNQNLDNINSLLSNIVDVNDASLNVTESVVVLVDNILDSYDSTTESTSDVSVPKAPNQIQRSLEKQITGLQTQPGNTTIEKDNIAIRAVKVPVTSVADDRLIFETVSAGDGSKLGTNSSMITTGETPSSEAEVAITFQLPKEILNTCDDNETLPVSFIIYHNAKLFPSTILANEAAKAGNVQRNIGSRIITANVEGITMVNLTSNPVQLYFTVIKQEANENVDNFECVFWDNDASNGFGDWSDEGCELNKTLPDGRVTCLCNHLTSFSVLVDRYGITNYILDVFSKIGCGVSIACLLVTIVTYLSSRSLRSKRPQRIFLNFCCSLLFLYTVFLFGIERTDPQIGCIVVSALLHYLTMTTLLWMAVEAFTMYINFVKVVGVHISKYLLKASLAAWGTPILIVAIIALSDKEQYHNDRHCFIRTGLAFFLTQVLLLAVTIAFNGNIFGRVMYRLTFGRVKSSARKKSEMKKRAQNALAISSLIGLTWVFGLLSLIHEDAALTFQILFCIFNSLQGLLVFTMFCLIKPEIHGIWKSWLLCQGVRVPYLTGISSSEVNNEPSGKTVSTADKDSKTAEVKGHESIKWEVYPNEQIVNVEVAVNIYQFNESN